MSQPASTRHGARRLIVSLAVGVLVAVASYLLAYFFLRGLYQSSTEVGSARGYLRSLAATVEEFKEKEGHYPATLSEMQVPLREDAAGRPVDYWQHPLQYSATADGFTLFSLGRDGEPGGEGVDADIHHDRPLEPPSLRRFTFELPTSPLRWTCVLTGLGAAVIVFRSRGGWGELLARAGATTIGALAVAFILSVLHIPSGH